MKVSSFIPKWWKNGAPDRMKLGTLMYLFLLLIAKEAFDQARLQRPWPLLTSS
jgi:hypothetical protein